MNRSVKREFLKLLWSHDWTYQYSDDQRYYKAGAAQAEAIRQFVNDHEEDRQELWNMYNEASPLTKVQDIMERAVSRHHFKAIPCGNYELSIQASSGHYCTPRETHESAKQYISFEVAINKRGGRMIKPAMSSVIRAFPKYHDLLISHPNQMVMGWISTELVNELYNYLKRHAR